MADPRLPLFVRQQPKPIPIRNPINGQLQPQSAIQNKADFPPLVPLSINASSLAPASKVPASATKRKDKKDGIDKDIGLAFNIYARPFVPESLTIINRLNGRTIETPATKRIHFAAYTSTFVGSAFLEPFPLQIALPINVAPDTITTDVYELYFRYHLEEEIKSQRLENELYSLYNLETTGTLEKSEDGTTYVMCTLTVPGLRENSPFIEEDDPIQIRQLNWDPSTRRPLGMDHWLAKGRVAGFKAPGWTNLVYNARVIAVKRKQEQIMVRIFNPATIAQLHSPPQRFNVQFPLPMDRYHPMSQALSIVQEAVTPVKRSPQPSGWQAPVLPRSIVPMNRSSGTTHQITQRPPWIQSMLFPTEADCEEQSNLNPGIFKRPFFDKELNYEQKKAIENVCSQNYGSLPFLISGPPGTGKTKTLVEIAIQLVKRVDKVSHILFCAPSDPAADTVAERLSAHFGNDELLRLNRLTRTFAEVPGSVLPYCYISDNNFDLPSFKQLMSYKIVVCSCRDASLILYSRMRNSDLYTAEHAIRNAIHPSASNSEPAQMHWTALLMDESAQAIEPEACIPLSIVAPPLDCGQLHFTPLFVMAGDEHQLGPRTSLRSSPLQTSLFGRLFQRTVYANHPLARGSAGTALPALNREMLPIARPAFANLIRNYRSHPAILAVPSALFYADTLEPEATGTDRLASWAGWQGRKWPVLFQGNNSDDDLEQDGGGWYNVGEARLACQYAAALVHSGLVTQKEVCIMSPFKAQVQCLRKTIREKQYGSLWEVDIGPCEAFQGLERGIVILCTTRSRERYLKEDKEVGWGIIGMPNKMNVALTRAKFGLIVIGKEDILLLDPNWKAFLDFCKRNGLVAGQTGALVKETFELTRLEKVLLAKEQKGDTRVIRGSEYQDEMLQHEQDPGDMDGYGFSDEEEEEEEEEEEGLEDESGHYQGDEDDE